MPRVIQVKAAKAVPIPRKCLRCGHEIQSGESYKWFKHRFQSPRYYCHAHNPRPSELTTSDKLATFYGASEGVEDDLRAFGEGTITIEDLASSLESAADEVEGAATEYEESASNMEEYFHSSSRVDEIREKADAATEFAEALREAARELETLSAEQESLTERLAGLDDEGNLPDAFSYDDDYTTRDTIEERLADIVSEATSQAEEALANLSI